jgi:transglutaminase-like putative cysteine protease
MPVFRIQHVTRYTYDRPVAESTNEMRIHPYPGPGRDTLLHELRITGQPDLHLYNDYWGNRTAVFNLRPPHHELVIDSRLVVRTAPATLPRNAAAGRADLESDLRSNLQLIELRQPDAIAAQTEIAAIVGQIDQPWKGVAAMVSDAASYIFQHFEYTKGITHIETTVDEILAHRGGVCQDFAHVMLQLLRTMGIPSRYVSGYICPNRNGLRGVGATHAWVEAWIPGHGWAGVDPTNNVWVTDEHVPLAVGRNFSDCTPVKGTFKGPARQQLTVYVSVGYEDGHTFEEVNEVRVSAQASEKEAPPPPVDHQAQQ